MKQLALKGRKITARGNALGMERTGEIAPRYDVEREMVLHGAKLKWSIKSLTNAHIIEMN